MNIRTTLTYQALLLGRLAVCLLAITHTTALYAASKAEVLHVDFKARIAQSEDSPSRFAVDVPHAASTSSSGEWTRSGGASRWTYAVTVPGAVSMSFYATEVVLPADAVLAVIVDGARYAYTAADVDGGDLWSRIGRGQTLTFELDVPTDHEDEARLQIASVQAGYRTLAPYDFNSLSADSQSTEFSTDCRENWVCQVTPANRGAGDATVALIVSNVGQCTGVLLNNVPGDGTPYILTARHCQNGNPDGGSPDAAANVTVYWNATTACGAALGSIYDFSLLAQRGAQTIVEQQDTWLIRLNRPPHDDIDLYFAGWDATGGTFVGGYTPHHASGTSRQFVGWYGQPAYFTVPAANLGVRYDSTMWGTVNALGAGGPGSSGAGLFDPANRLVGTVVRGRHTSDGVGVCPSSTPSVPSEPTATAMAIAFAGVFDSTADPSSTTGSMTLRAALDPGNTGTLVLAGRRRPITVTITNDGQTFLTGSRVSLDWTSTGATECVASGGETGDGWAGTLQTRGWKTVENIDGGDVTYTVTCNDGERVGTASATIKWILSPPEVYLRVYGATNFGEPFQLIWTSNVRPCVASEGSGADGWGGALDMNGAATVTARVVGPVDYTLTCGTDAGNATQRVTVNVAAPSAVLTADVTKIRVGQEVYLHAVMNGAPCFRTGGRAGDGWASSVPVAQHAYSDTVSSEVAGIVSFGVTCGSGSHVASSEVSVEFTNDAPAIALNVSRSTDLVVGDTITFSWDANVRQCGFRWSGPDRGVNSPADSTGSWSVRAHAIGDHTFSITCGVNPDIAEASMSVTFTGTPSVGIGAPEAVVRGKQFRVSYSANVVPCTLAGRPGSAWDGQYAFSEHAVDVIEPNVGTVTFTVTCGSGPQAVSASIDVVVVADPPVVTLTADVMEQVTGLPVTLTWSSNVSPCVAREGPEWTGTFGSAGSHTIVERTAGSRSYSIACGTGSLMAFASVGVFYANVAAPALSANKVEAMVGEPITITWASKDGAECTAVGELTWSGSRAPAGIVTVVQRSPGLAQFSLKCGESLTARMTVTVRAAGGIPNQPLRPSVNVTASPSSVTAGAPFTLSWTTANALNCSAQGTGQSIGWTGDLGGDGGSLTLTEKSSGTYSYQVICYGPGGLSATASVSVDVFGSPQSDSGGGGAMVLLEVALLLLLALGRKGVAARGAAGQSASAGEERSFSAAPAAKSRSTARNTRPPAKLPVN